MCACPPTRRRNGDIANKAVSTDLQGEEIHSLNLCCVVCCLDIEANRGCFASLNEWHVCCNDINSISSLRRTIIASWNVLFWMQSHYEVVKFRAGEIRTNDKKWGGKSVVVSYVSRMIPASYSEYNSMILGHFETWERSIFENFKSRPRSGTKRMFYTTRCCHQLIWYLIPKKCSKNILFFIIIPLSLARIRESEGRRYHKVEG